MRRVETRWRPRRAWWLVAAIASTFVPASCSGDGEAEPPTTLVSQPTSPPPTRPDDGVLSLGVFLPQTGPGATLGQPMIAAIQGAINTINGAGGVLGGDVQLTIVDEEAGTGLDDLVAAGVDAIVGPASSLVALSQLEAIVQPGTGLVACSPTASALALDDYPDNKLFFRTVPSDSLQMAALAERADATGVDSVAVGYLDDPYGRGLLEAFIAQAATRNFELVAQVPFSGAEEDLSIPATDLLAGNPGVVVALGDADDGGRLLVALDDATDGDDPPEVIVNDAMRTARQAVQTLSDDFRKRLTGVAPLSRAVVENGPAGAFSAHAVDCVNLIALAAVEAQSDAPVRIQANMASVSVGGRVCTTFIDCAEKLEQGLSIDYNGLSGDVELSNTSGDVVSASFEAFGFNEEGVDQELSLISPFDVP